MNNIDKQYAWDMVWLLFQHHAPHLVVESLVSSEQTVVTVEIARLYEVDKQWQKVQQIAAASPEPALLTDEEIATLKILVSTAVWIRSEQLAHPNAVIIAPYANEAEKKFDAAGVSAMIDTHNMHIHNLRHEFEAGQKLFTKLAQYCKDHAIADPEWRK